LSSYGLNMSSIIVRQDHILHVGFLTNYTKAFSVIYLYFLHYYYYCCY
jgi:hypothetical protein